MDHDKRNLFLNLAQLKINKEGDAGRVKEGAFQVIRERGKLILKFMGLTDEREYPNLFLRLKKEKISLIGFLLTCIEAYIEDDPDFRNFFIKRKKMNKISKKRELDINTISGKIKELYNFLYLSDEEMENLKDIK